LIDEANNDGYLMSQEFRHLIQTDTARARSLLYLRLLYSSHYTEFIRTLMREERLRIPPTTLAVLETVDFDLLTIEQSARKRNVLRHILRAAPSLEVALSGKQLSDLAESFVNSTAFWSARGRSLIENFCLFAFDLLELNSFKRDVMRLCGVVAGISVDHEAASPWPLDSDVDSTPLIDGALATETFLSNWRLLDESGALPAVDNIKEVSQPGAHRIIVASMPGPKVIALSLII
jgi:hypothetical protein